MSGAVAAVLGSVYRGRLLRSLLLWIVALAIGVAVVVGMFWQYGLAQRDRDAEVAALQLTRQAAHDLEALRTTLPERQARVRMLRSQGFTVAATRVDWAERVAGLVSALRPLGYAVDVGAETARALPAPLQEWFDARGMVAPELLTTDLSLQVQGLHERELLRVVAAAKSAGSGLVRLEHCQIERRADGMGLDAKCRLRRYALPVSERGTRGPAA